LSSWEGAGVASMRTAAAAPNMAALRVNIGSFLHLKFSNDANLGLS
jgi:hypothetical protein